MGDRADGAQLGGPERLEKKFSRRGQTRVVNQVRRRWHIAGRHIDVAWADLQLQELRVDDFSWIGLTDYLAPKRHPWRSTSRTRH